MATDDKPSLLVLTSTFPRWSGDVTPPFVYELSRRLTRTFDVTVLAPHAPGAADEERLDGIQVHRYRYAPERWERLAYEGGILPRLRRQPWLALLVLPFLAAQFVAVRRRLVRCDVVHAHWVLPQGLVAVAAGRKPVLCTAHGGDLFGLRGIVAGWLKRWTLRRVDRLAVVSEILADAAIAAGVDRARTVVAPMGVDLKMAFTPGASPGGGDGHLLFVGRLVAKKGGDVLIRALPAVLERHPRARLTVVGDGPERDVLEVLANRQGVAAAVTFTGPVPNRELPALFRSATAVAFPSLVDSGGDREGFGLVAVEAMGCGCAVVGSDLPAMRDFLRHEETGLVVEAGSESDLAQALIRLLDDPGLRRELGAAGRTLVESRYDWDAVADNYATLLHATQTGTHPDGGESP